MTLEESEMGAVDLDIPEEELVLEPSTEEELSLEVEDDLADSQDISGETIIEDEAPDLIISEEEDLGFQEPEQEEPMSEEIIGDEAIPDLHVEGFDDVLDTGMEENPLAEEPESATAAVPCGDETDFSEIPENLKAEIRSVLSYMDQLLESLPEEKIQEFARSDHFDTYKKLFEELGLKV